MERNLKIENTCYRITILTFAVLHQVAVVITTKKLHQIAKIGIGAVWCNSTLITGDNKLFIFRVKPSSICSKAKVRCALWVSVPDSLVSLTSKGLIVIRCFGDRLGDTNTKRLESASSENRAISLTSFPCGSSTMIAVLVFWVR